MCTAYRLKASVVEAKRRSKEISEAASSRKTRNSSSQANSSRLKAARRLIEQKAGWPLRERKEEEQRPESTSSQAVRTFEDLIVVEDLGVSEVSEDEEPQEQKENYAGPDAEP